MGNLPQSHYILKYGGIMKHNSDLKVLIEFGSNTAKVLSANMSEGKEGCFYRLPLRLASQINGKEMMTAAGIKAILKTIDDVKKRFPETDDIILIATEALRRARNSDEIKKLISEQFGLKLRILTWEEEAEAAYRGVIGTKGVTGFINCFDIGGSSTEIIKGNNEKILYSKSFPLGAVNLSQRFIRKQPPTQCMYLGLQMELERELAWNNPFAKKLVGTGGAVYTCAMVALMNEGKNEAEALKEIDGYEMRRSEILRQERTYRALTLDQIRLIPGMDPSRVDIMLAAVMIISRIMDSTKSSNLIVSNRGVRHGIMFAEGVR